MNLNNKLAYVSGAGSGIGRETALVLAKSGCRLAITDICEESLRETASLIGESVVFIHRLDVADESAYRQCAGKLIGDIGVPDIVVNNAGVGLTGFFNDYSLLNWQWIIGINLKGVIHGCHFFAPAMLERGSGQIVNISSGLGLFAAPKMSAYCASKYAVVGLSESLRSEFSTSGVGVTVICPGIVNTAITKNMRVASGEQAAVRATTSAMYQRRNYTPDKIAARIVRAIEKNHGVVPVCPETHIAYALKRLSPRFSSAILSRLMAKTLDPSIIRC